MTEHDSSTPSADETQTAATLGGLSEATFEPKETIGPYRLISVLGEGGMGIVFLAEQEKPLRRRVALKVMRSPFASRTTRARFEAEREAMARLSHPAVGQIFEASATEDGHPYFVMELIDGHSITEFCDEHRLGIRERIELFCRICAGVHHAHQKGILHRDLKPSNVLVTLVDGEPVPKIIDFGVAKALDRPLVDVTLETREAAVVGTPAYLSPEAIRCEEDLDLRADVYSLGVLLFELLAGVPPHDPKTTPLFGLLQRVAEEEPPEPSSRVETLDGATREEVASRRMLPASTHSRQLRGDLDWIVVKAMARDRETRYGSASDLAADLERHLRHEAVLASPPNRLYRWGKALRRHQGAAGTLVLVLVLLAGGFFARTLEAAKAQREAVRANQEAERANREAAAARRAQQEAEEVVAFLQELFQVSAPGESLGDDVTAREILDRGAERVRSSLEEQPLVAARMMATIGEVYRQLGLFEPAEALQREGLDLRREHPEAQRGELAESLRLLGLVLDDSGRLPEAEALYRESLAIREEVDGAESLAVAEIVNNLAIVDVMQGRLKEAAEEFERTLRIRETHLGTEDPNVAAAYANLANIYSELGRREAARGLYERARTLQERVLGPDHPHLAYTLHNFGYLELDLGNVERSRQLLERALAIREKVLGEEHPQVARTLGVLGRAALAAKDGRSAEEHLARALAIEEASYGREALPLATTLAPLGRAVLMQGRPDEARAHLQRAIAVIEAVLGPGHVESAEAHIELGLLELGEGRREAAARYLTAARSILAEAGRDPHPEMMAGLEELGLGPG